MRLHRITLRDVRGVAERTVHLPESGVVVVEGPNEIGKSTLLEAFDRLLELKSTSRSARAQALQPIGRDVGPYVEAEFTLDGQRLRLAKRWLRSPMTELEVLAPRPEQLTGSAAQERLEQLLRGCLDTTLWEALRLTQSGDGTVLPLVSSGVLREALDTAADAHLHDGGGERVLDLVEEEYLSYFTARTGRPTGDYKAAIADHAQSQSEVAEAHRRVVEAEELLELLATARERVAALTGEADEARGALTGAQDRAAGIAALVAAEESASARLGEAAELARAAEAEVGRRRIQVREVADLEEVLAGHEEQMDRLARAAQELLSQVEGAQGETRRTEALVETAETRLEEARAELDRLEQHEEVRRLEGVLAEIDQRAAAVDRAREAVPARPVTRETVREVEALAHELEVQRARHEAASPRVVVRALSDGSGVTVRGADQEDGPVSAGEERTFVATDDLEVDVPGAAHVVVRAAADSAGRVAALDRAREALVSSLDRAGHTDLDGLRTAARATETAEATWREARRDLESVLRAHGAAADLPQVEAGAAAPSLLRRLEQARHRFTVATADVEEWQPGGDVDAARQAEHAAGRKLREAREARRGAGATMSARREEARRVQAELDRLVGRVEGERARHDRAVTELSGSREVASDDELAAGASSRTATLEEARVRAEAARTALSDAGADAVTAALARAEGALTRAQHELGEARDRMHTLTGHVEQAAGEGRQELYDLAVAGLDEAERRLVALDRRARAARHLRTTLHEHRDAAHRAYVRPFTEALERLGRRVYGQTFGVTVDEQLSVVARTLHGTTVPHDQLSGGAREQLGILARLAVAQLVDPARGVPVVIDDALGWTDPDRLEQMSQVLGGGAAGGEDVQVVLLTCTPDRYASIPGARTVRLQAS
ncbi:DNA double-strand break repair Rad50 ATPase [Serinicoccus hydrothermalis]|uniref:DNA double-strand break repair Rad50 ATPase n=1 Tax=Serinicoccus hydrothermalis TaxID=1758689 RepID=A0A1B1NBI0_9MICO|nr:AAA family ATPase [Serinicoccus hydrothermalis]ANS78787.1 DNA double-strand break repair Rad50 ATPase [Serinicoccus hydrothermalis]